MKLYEIENIANINYGTRVVKKRDSGTIYDVYGGGGKTFKVDSFNRESCVIVSRFGMSAECVRKVDGKFFLNDSGLSVETKDSNVVIQKYIDWFLFSKMYDIYLLGRGAAQKNLDVDKFRLIKIPVPSLQEQEKIVERLDKVFETTNTISSINEKKNDLFDLLNKSFYEGLFENMKIFPSVELIEVCKLITDGSHFSPKEFSNEYPYITVKDIDNYGNIDFVNCKKIDKELFLKMKNNNCNPLFGDILFSKDGTIGKTSLIEGEDEFVVLSSLAIIRPDQTKINKNFLFNLISSPKFIELCVAKKTGVAIQRIILKNLKTVILPVPPLEIQEELSKKIDKFKKYLKILENNLNSTDIKKEEFKKSILKKEFSYE